MRLPLRDARLEVHANAEKLQQILFNLLSNAIKFEAHARERGDGVGTRDQLRARARDGGELVADSVVGVGSSLTLTLLAALPGATSAGRR